MATAVVLLDPPPASATCPSGGGGDGGSGVPGDAGLSRLYVTAGSWVGGAKNGAWWRTQQALRCVEFPFPCNPIIASGSDAPRKPSAPVPGTRSSCMACS